MPGNIPPDKKAAFERLANHLDEEYPYPGCRDDLRDVASGSSAIIERAYWRDPVQVMTGLAWMFVGLMIGVLL